jgi:hemerythrin-like domain-containing protein
MPVQIGTPAAPDFSRPLELLSDCHRRIERFLSALIQVTEQAQGRQMTPSQRRDWLNALEYFKTAAPRHNADEEDSLFPRLREMNSPEAQQTLADVERLEAEHERTEQLHALVDELGRQWLAQGTLSRQDVGRIRGALAELGEIYEQHIAFEDRDLFPVAAALLSKSAKTEMGREMAKRRGLDLERLARIRHDIG